MVIFYEGKFNPFPGAKLKFNCDLRIALEPLKIILRSAMALTERIGFIGGGVMASAMVGGLLRSGLTIPSKIFVSDPYPGSIQKLAALGVRTTSDNNEVFLGSDVIILAVKPNVVSPVLKALTEFHPAKDFETKSFISIAAGIPLSTIESCLPASTKSVIRAMPNTPCTVGACATAIALGTASQASDKLLCETIFKSFGTCSDVPEHLLDAVTGEQSY